MKKPIIALILAAALLLGLSVGLDGMAVRNAEQYHLKLMQTLLPGATEFTLEPYAGEDANIRSVHKSDIGFVVETVTYGYAGEITMLVGVNNAGRVTGVVVQKAQETFGLGGKDFAKKTLDKVDEKIEKMLPMLGEEDVLLVMADHGNDPNIGHNKHTRENVPLLVYRKGVQGVDLGLRKSLSDVGATVCDFFGVKAPQNGESFLELLK